jgi:hypothetical protein
VGCRISYGPCCVRQLNIWGGNIEPEEDRCNLNVKTNDNYDYHTVKPNNPFTGVSLGCDARKYSPEFSGVHMMQEDRMDHRDYSLEQACSFPTEESEERGVFPALDQSAVGFKFGRVLEIGKNTVQTQSISEVNSILKCSVQNTKFCSTIS